MVKGLLTPPDDRSVLDDSLGKTGKIFFFASILQMSVFAWPLRCGSGNAKKDPQLRLGEELLR